MFGNGLAPIAELKQSSFFRIENKGSPFVSSPCRITIETRPNAVARAYGWNLKHLGIAKPQFQYGPHRLLAGGRQSA